MALFDQFITTDLKKNMGIVGLTDEFFCVYLDNLLRNQERNILVVEGNHEIIDYSHMSIIEHVNLYVEDGMNEKDAIKVVAKERNIAKSVVYKEYHMGK